MFPPVFSQFFPQFANVRIVAMSICMQDDARRMMAALTGQPVGGAGTATNSPRSPTKSLRPPIETGGAGQVVASPRGALSQGMGSTGSGLSTQDTQQPHGSRAGAAAQQLQFGSMGVAAVQQPQCGGMGEAPAQQAGMQLHLGTGGMGAKPRSLRSSASLLHPLSTPRAHMQPMQQLPSIPLVGHENHWEMSQLASHASAPVDFDSVLLDGLARGGFGAQMGSKGIQREQAAQNRDLHFRRMQAEREVEVRFYGCRQK